ncbi:MAG TPA: hypothetical protein VD931_16265 [Baekduia sp.]|nr:hypothetical protein [Baekduia sp.]
MRLVLLTLLAVLALVAPAGAVVTPATEAGVVQRTADQLRTSNVVVDPAAELAFGEDRVARLKARIAEADIGPVYVAILPAAAVEEAGGDADTLLREIARSLGREGTYGLIAGRAFRAGSTTRRDADEAATAAARDAQGRGAAVALEGWIDRLADGSPGSGAGGSGAPMGGTLIVLGVLGGGALVVAGVSRRRRRREVEAQLAELRDAAHDDLVALGEDVRSVDLDIEMPGADPRARDQLRHALAAYEKAEAGLDRARHPDDFEHITATIEDGRFAMAACRALLDGREPPQRRPPCFFDPRHGPSTDDVLWAPEPGLPEREVPVCAADAVRLATGHDPQTRHVRTGGELVPYYAAPAHFGPWAGGFFGATGGLLPGLLMGGMLGSMLSPGMAWGDGGGLDGGGFDAGGFDVGGGDFGGFGGGDFGGGDL